MATWITTCLLLVAGQTGSEPWYTNQTRLRVPFNIEPGRRPEFREVRLFVSADKGKTWRQEGNISPEQDHFVFLAPGDGEYWLRTAAVNRQGKQEPENIPLVPEASTKKLIIDTLRPVVKLTSAQKQGDEVVVTWEVTEEHPDPRTLRLEYQVQGGPWTIVPIMQEATGKGSFRPNSQATVSIRMVFKDRAGNESMATTTVPGSGGITPTGFSNSPVPAPPPLGSSAPVPSPSGAGTSDMRTNPPALADSSPAMGKPGQNSGFPGEPAPSPGFNPQGAGTVPGFSSPASSGPVTGPNRPSDSRPLASPDVNQGTAFGATGIRSLLPLRYVNHRQLTLEYEVSNPGRSGLGSVDLWFTPDDGRNWIKTPTLSQKDVQKDGRYQRVVELQEGDGIYGFALVVRSRAGRGKAPPRTGDTPEIRVELDTTPPQAQLNLPPQADPAQPDTLVLTWTARDKNLAANPISLEWSEYKAGPWQPIALDLANTGRFAWKLPASMPVQVYLRLRARDLAGNEGVMVSPEPQLVDLTEPEGRLVNVSVYQQP